MSQNSSINREALLSGNRRALAKAITLIESTNSQDRSAADELVQSILPDSGRSLRIGISGTPGVGKSTFIEALGLHITGLGKKLAVLAVDPSSPVNGGSILGDKTRMERLSREENAFIRPSPSSGQLGGVAQKTRESILLCEAAGFDVILVETVGVGQSEIEVASMVDFFLLLMQPNSGDELQGIKRGILELAQALVINKADGDGLAFANQTQAHCQSAVELLSTGAPWKTKVLTCSALKNKNIDKVWEMLESYAQQGKENGMIEQRRRGQNRDWMLKLFQNLLEQHLDARHGFSQAKNDVARSVESGQTTAYAGAKELLSLLK